MSPQNIISAIPRFVAGRTRTLPVLVKTDRDEQRYGCATCGTYASLTSVAQRHPGVFDLEFGGELRKTLMCGHQV